MTDRWWMQTTGRKLLQGDLLPNCLLPVFTGVVEPRLNVVSEESLNIQTLIVITQSCDLENEKVQYVALCPIYRLTEFEAVNPAFNQKRWEEVRKGRVEALHLLASPEQPENNLHSYVVDFGHIVSLPFDYLTTHAISLGDRWRLQSPFLEHSLKLLRDSS